MRIGKIFVLAALLALLGPMVAGGNALCAERETHVLLGRIKSVLTGGELIRIETKSTTGREVITFRVERGANVTFKGSPAELDKMAPGTEVLVTYYMEKAKPVCIAVRRIR